MLSIAAHDLKNPLTILSVWSQLISDAKNNPEEVEKFSERIKEAANKMNKLVNDLLETAKKEANKIQLKSQKIQLAILVESVVKTNEVLASKKKIQLQFIVKDTPVIMGDEDRVTEIADNLINNAIKYSPLDKKIYITVLQENEFAVLQVKDEGQGLTADDKKNLFQRFVKLSAEPTGGETSTGLGLSIVKSLVDAHHGEITFESKGKSMGSTFIVKLPQVKE